MKLIWVLVDLMERKQELSEIIDPNHSLTSYSSYTGSSKISTISKDMEKEDVFERERSLLYYPEYFIQKGDDVVNRVAQQKMTFGGCPMIIGHENEIFT